MHRRKKSSKDHKHHKEHRKELKHHQEHRDTERAAGTVRTRTASVVLTATIAGVSETTAATCSVAEALLLGTTILPAGRGEQDMRGQYDDCESNC